MKHAIGTLVLACVLVFAFYDVTLVLDVSLSGETEVPDPEAEAEYRDCYTGMDREIHATAFGTVDNPDVQKEFINARRAIAEAVCRAAYPVSMITVETPLRFDLLDLEPRYW
ncbi:MAG: hypothetical protein OEV41_00915 [Gammaproteobacteria bacterium]|nr:hypothetical protein [Gammaproteobacteria bacterium]